jgi:lambda repressor-like predicted transcriptional regulator
MANERLKAALVERGESVDTLSTLCQVDRKTVERWIAGRAPYTKYRRQIARHLRLDETYLWPGSTTQEQIAAASGGEILNVFPFRSSVPRETWSFLFDSARESIDVLAYSAMFLADDVGIQALIKAKASAGVEVRILMGDPESAEVRARGIDEGIDDAMASKARNALVQFGKLLPDEHIEIRLHATTLYNSIYRADGDMLVNTHIYGEGAGAAPVLHLRRIHTGTMVSTYLRSFERVWAGARPANGSEA